VKGLYFLGRDQVKVRDWNLAIENQKSRVKKSREKPKRQKSIGGNRPGTWLRFILQKLI